MANHAYVYGGDIPSNEEVNAVVCEVVEKKFPMLDILFEPDTDWNSDGSPGYWRVQRKSDEGEECYHAVEFFRTTHHPPPEYYGVSSEDWEDEECLAWEAQHTEKLDCLEFRHGHGFQLWWWIEYEIREELACRFGCHQEDDGTGATENYTERYDTYADYLKAIHKGMPDDWRSYQRKMDRELLERAKWGDLAPIIGDL
jgi:hypothetical protein